VSPAKGVRGYLPPHATGVSSRVLTLI